MKPPLGKSLPPTSDKFVEKKESCRNTNQGQSSVTDFAFVSSMDTQFAHRARSTATGLGARVASERLKNQAYSGLL